MFLLSFEKSTVPNWIRQWRPAKFQASVYFSMPKSATLRLPLIFSLFFFIKKERRKKYVRVLR